MGALFSNIERRDSGPAHLDRTSDEYYAPESEVTQDRIDAADDLFCIGPQYLTPQEAQLLRGWE